MRCPSCEFEIEDGVNQCSLCGSGIGKQSAAPVINKQLLPWVVIVLATVSIFVILVASGGPTGGGTASPSADSTKTVTLGAGEGGDYDSFVIPGPQLKVADTVQAARAQKAVATLQKKKHPQLQSVKPYVEYWDGQDGRHYTLTYRLDKQDSVNNKTHISYITYYLDERGEVSVAESR